VIAVGAEAGSWFGRKKVVKLEPAVGYIEKEEVVEASWDQCMSNYEAGRVEERVFFSARGGFRFYATNGMTNRISYIGWHEHKCPKCTKKHISDYPKSSTWITGEQMKLTTEIYKDGEVVTSFVEYKYPHKKITTVDTVGMERKTNTVVTVETTKKGSDK